MSSFAFSKSALVLTGVLATGLLLSGCGIGQRVGKVFNRGVNATVEPEQIDTVISPTAGERVTSLSLSAKANADLNNNYKNDPDHKAFAASPSGAFGVAFGAASMRDAKQAALEKCMQDVTPGDLECIVYDVNGVRVFRPTELRRVR